MSKYEKLDAEILRRIRNNNGLTFIEVVRAEVLKEAEKLCEGMVGADPERKIDQRLQALRRRKLIEYRTKASNAPQGWYARTAKA